MCSTQNADLVPTFSCVTTSGASQVYLNVMVLTNVVMGVMKT